MRVLGRLVVAVIALLGGAAGVAVHLGCSQSHPPGPSTVRGRVTFQGKPVAGGLIVFAPDPARGASGKPARAETQPDGSFQLLYDGGPAVRPGWYRVAIAPPPGADIASAYGSVPFPHQLRRPDQSGLVREVIAGKDHVFEFAVEVPNG